MAYFTDEKIEQLLDDPEVVKRLIDFISMDGAAYFEEVRSNLSPEDLEEYLKSYDKPPFFRFFFKIIFIIHFDGMAHALHAVIQVFLERFLQLLFISF